MDFFVAIGLFAAGWAATISGVIVGGWLVYKASGGRQMFKPERGSAYNLDEDILDPDQAEPPEMPDGLMNYNQQFKDQYDPGVIFEDTRAAAVKPAQAPVEDEDGFIVEEENNEKD